VLGQRFVHQGDNAMTAIAPLTSGHTTAARLVASPAAEKPQDDLTAREAFQDFVAGTFFKQMLKSLRATQGKPAYFHGGQAEEMFQSQLDQQVAEDLAKTHGAPFADRLFEAFSNRQRSVNLSSRGEDVASAYGDMQRDDINEMSRRA
jgi:Rod binding domain-containing protein